VERKPTVVIPASTGGRIDFYISELELVFTIRDYTLGPNEIPYNLEEIKEYFFNFLKLNKRGLQPSEGINYIKIINFSTGKNLNISHQQVYNLTFNIKMIYGKLNLLVGE
jgi:hypothetical protein